MDNNVVKHIALIPAYKPDQKMLDTLKDLKSKGFEVVIINDGSGFEYTSVFETAKNSAKVLTHACNMGKGAALKTGMKYINKTYDPPYVIVTADADGQHVIDDICRVCRKTEENPEYLILGSRKMKKILH